jgi:hypothetical protein
VIGRRLLAAVLAVWQVGGFTFTASRALPSLGFRGWIAIVELLVAGLVAALSLAAAWSLWSQAPAAVALTRIALVLATLRGVQSLYWTYLPSDVVPGTETTLAAALIVHAALWLWYLARPERAASIRS